MVRVIEKKRGDSTFLLLDVYYNGKRTTKATGFKLTGDKHLDKRLRLQAEKMAAEMMLKLAEYNYNIDALRPGFTDFLEYYRRLVAEKPVYIRRGNVLNHLERFSPKGLSFDDINHSFWERFRYYLDTEVNLAPATIFTMFGILKTVLNRAVRDKIITGNPLSTVVERKPVTERKFLTYNDLSTLINRECSNNEIKEAFLFSCFTGIRLGDIISLSWDNIKDDTVRLIQQKTGNFVSIPLTEPAKNLLQNRPSKKGKVFSLPVKSSLSIVIKNWARGAGFAGITFHSARHTFATLALTFGASIESVSDMLGHSDIKTTRIYARILDEKKKADAAKFPKFE